MKKNVCLLIALILTIMNLAGCGYTIDSDITPDARLSKQAFEVNEFDLGEYTKDAGNAPYKLQGVIGVPKESENCPVVIIMHGADAESKERPDRGYSYLVSELASYGMLALSIDVSAQYENAGETGSFDTLSGIFKGHFDKLKNALTEGGTQYGIDIAGKGDIAKLGLIAQDISAQGALKIAKEYQDVVKGGLLINPVYAADIGLSYPDVNIGIVIPQFAGDGKGFYGQDIYEDLRKEYERVSWTASAFLYGANNNYFNAQTEKDDGISQEGRISREDQEKFLKNYAADFMNAAFLMQKKPAMLMLSEFNKKQYDGLDVMTSFVAGERVILANNDIGGLYPKNGSLLSVVDSKTSENNTDGTFMSPVKDAPLKLYSFRWDNTEIEENQEAYASANYPDPYKDLSKCKYLTLYMAADPTDEFGAPGETLDISVRIKDKNKKEATVRINKEAGILKYPQVSSQNEDGLDFAIPLGCVSVPLYQFGNVDLRNVFSVEIIVGKGNMGAIMVGELSAAPAPNVVKKKQI